MLNDRQVEHTDSKLLIESKVNNYELFACHPKLVLGEFERFYNYEQLDGFLF